MDWKSVKLMYYKYFVLDKNDKKYFWCWQRSWNAMPAGTASHFCQIFTVKQSFGWIGSQIHMKNHTTTFNFYENEIWKSVTANQPVTHYCKRAESWPDSCKNNVWAMSMLPRYFFTYFMILTNSRGHEDTRTPGAEFVWACQSRMS